MEPSSSLDWPRLRGCLLVMCQSSTARVSFALPIGIVLALSFFRCVMACFTQRYFQAGYFLYPNTAQTQHYTPGGNQVKLNFSIDLNLFFLISKELLDSSRLWQVAAASMLPRSSAPRSLMLTLTMSSSARLGTFLFWPDRG